MYNSIKRLGDIFSAFVALVVLSPLFLICIIILSFTGEREVFYKQKRIGFKNKSFGIWKFATMLKDSEKIGTGAITVRNDPRVTSFGKFLRKTKINELPQILNVLDSSMSVVGPRPLMQVSFDQYTKDVQSKIYNSKPGITGIGSIIFRDEEEIVSTAKENGEDPWVVYSNVIYPYKGKVEMWYQSKKSFITDLKIIFLTAWVILVPKSNLTYSWFPDLPKRNF